MKMIVLGGDGFCGWPAALHLSARGHAIIIVDNSSRRKIDVELEVGSLTPIRVEGFTAGENYRRLLTLLQQEQPDAVIHFAKQRAAPYSVKSGWHKRYTVSNNLNATNDLPAAIVESGQDIHLVHLATMGVYGYGTAGTRSSIRSIPAALPPDQDPGSGTQTEETRRDDRLINRFD